MAAPETAPILIIGQSGQLAQALVAGAAAAGRPVVAMGRHEVDLADRARLARAVERVGPSAVINAGAYTRVDAAESEREAAYALNADGPGVLADLCAGAGVPIVHVSTDCVFDGLKAGAYTEEDAPNPESVYGQSKLAGERAVAERAERHMIARVSWVFSAYAGSFVKIMLTLAQDRDTLRVVADQFGHPTHADDVAAGLFTMVDAACAPGFEDWGTYHLAGDTATHRAGQAERVLAASARLGGPTAAVEPISTADFGAAAPRPANACLDARRARTRFGLQFGDWETQTDATVAALLRSF
ncbi:MAG: dTDP-4-dehydrorhamnose reductase [Pseudomonadota bacterium]